MEVRFVMIGLIIIVIIVVSVVPALFVVRKAFGPVAANRRLLSTGQSAKAKILQAQETGTYVNEMPQIRVLLEVRPTSGSSFQSEAVTTVRPLQLSQIRVGNTVDVRYDPADPSKVALALG
ncbi:MAG: hypothetical protein ACT4PI_05615 [Actinomycetota bacterium]